MKINLTAYTIAKNCSDINDIISGIREINESIELYITVGKTVPTFWYIRLNKLNCKLNEIQNKK